MPGLVLAMTDPKRQAWFRMRAKQQQTTHGLREMASAERRRCLGEARVELADGSEAVGVAGLATEAHAIAGNPLAAFTALPQSPER